MSKREKPKKRGGGAPEPRRWTLRSSEDQAPPPPPHEKLKDLEMPSVFAMERSMRGLQDGGQARWMSPRQQAQDLFYEAAEAARDREVKTAVRLAGKALDTYPRCVDAMMLLMDFSGGNLETRLKTIRGIVRAGEEDLGPKCFKENRGHFWLMLETRPYMRARQRLAELLEEADLREESVREYEAILDLNPNDNQGVRYCLIGQYLALARLEDLRRLLKQFEDEGSAMWAWARVLERFLSGDLEGAAKALREARNANRYAEAYLTGKKRVPSRMPEYWSPGQESEGVLCGDVLGAAWQKHPDAVAWVSGTK
jgi:tetratricopeptide (TPR) repeat protein